MRRRAERAAGLAIALRSLGPAGAVRSVGPGGMVRSLGRAAAVRYLRRAAVVGSLGRVSAARILVGATIAVLSGAALAYGPEGHMIAGRVAAGYLCPAAVAAVGRLADGDGLDELGLWADRIRRDPAYADSAPWHYMNIDDNASIDDYVSPPEGDVLEALNRFHAVLADSSAPARDRAEALRFLVHFVVDIHQPLHVGRAEDRGGNTIELDVDGERINLHRLWDTEAVTSAGLGVVAYARSIAEDVTPEMLAEPFDPKRWAQESKALRPEVYSFSGDRPDAAYLAQARRITRRRLTLAAARLAGTLNDLYCR